MDNSFFEELSFLNISVMSGIRPRGRTVDKRARGRCDSGFLYIWSGEVFFKSLSGDTVAASDGELVFLPKLEKYSMEYKAESTVFVLVNFDSFDSSGREVNLFDKITKLLKDDKLYSVSKIMTSFELCSASKTLAAALRKKELIYRLLGAICSSAPALSSRRDIDSRIFPGVQLLEQRYLENLPISIFAEACHISLSSFRAHFQRQFGISPVRYRNNLRVERAKELLYEGSSSIAEVAYASGFENVGYFCRCFKQITGEFPTKKKNQKI